MNNVGIVAEYNPFHNGHLYHLKETKKLAQAEHVVAIMSGDFTQRGEPAMYDKWIRAEMAVKNGVDLVIELPFVFACNSAEYFAMGAMGILNGLGCITHFSFGSETGELKDLQKIAELLLHEDPIFKEALKAFLSEGYSYPRAQFEALKELLGEAAAVIRVPNNILAVEYLKQWIRSGSLMRPIVIKREGKGYHETDINDPFASATAIRQMVAEKQDMAVLSQAVPKATADIMISRERRPVTDSEGLYKMLVYKILTSSSEELAQILSVTEGLENKLKKAVIKSKNTEELIRSILSKRYTKTRINRLLLHTLTSLKKNDFFAIAEKPPFYARILGFSPEGAKLLRHIGRKGCSKIPLLNNLNKEVEEGDPIRTMLHYDVLAADIYNLAYNGETYKCSDHIRKPYCSQEL